MADELDLPDENENRLRLLFHAWTNILGIQMRREKLNMKKFLTVVIAMALLLSAAAAESVVLGWDDFKEQAETIGGTFYDFDDYFSAWVPDSFTRPDEEKRIFVRSDGSSDVEKIEFFVADPGMIDRFPSWSEEYEEFTINGGCARALLTVTDEMKAWFGCICFENSYFCIGISYNFDVSADDEAAKQFYLMLLSAVKPFF